MKKNAPFLVRLVIFCLWPIIAPILFFVVALALFGAWFMFFSDRFVITRGALRYHPTKVQRILLIVFWPIIAPVFLALSAILMVLAWPVTLFKTVITYR